MLKGWEPYFAPVREAVVRREAPDLVEHAAFNAVRAGERDGQSTETLECKLQGAMGTLAGFSLANLGAGIGILLSAMVASSSSCPYRICRDTEALEVLVGAVALTCLGLASLGVIGVRRLQPVLRGIIKAGLSPSLLHPFRRQILGSGLFLLVFGVTWFIPVLGPLISGLTVALVLRAWSATVMAILAPSIAVIQVSTTSILVAMPYRRGVERALGEIASSLLGQFLIPVMIGAGIGVLIRFAERTGAVTNESPGSATVRTAQPAPLKAEGWNAVPPLVGGGMFAGLLATIMLGLFAHEWSDWQGCLAGSVMPPCGEMKSDGGPDFDHLLSGIIFTGIGLTSFFFAYREWRKKVAQRSGGTARPQGLGGPKGR
jgi:hypothetical protein